MERKRLRILFVSLVIILSFTSVLLICILPSAIGIPGLEVTLAEERIYSSPGTSVEIEFFLDVSNVNPDNGMGVKFNTNATIDSELIAHISNPIGHVNYIVVILNPSIDNLGETIEVIVTISSGIFSQTESVYVVVN